MKTVFLLPVIVICSILEAIKLLKNTVKKEEVSEYSVEGK
jgi:hypothetical protein